MKIKKIRRTAFFNLRVLAAFLLFLTAGMLTLFAFTGAQQPDNNTQTIRSSGWLTRLASTLGIVSRAQRGGAVKLDKYPAERPPGATQPPARPYTGPVRNLRPVTPVRTGKLRDMPWTAPDASRWRGRTFDGFRRPHGRAGAANHWIVIPLVFCENRNLAFMREAFSLARQGQFGGIKTAAITKAWGRGPSLRPEQPVGLQ